MAARRAGYNPNTTPTATEIKNATDTLQAAKRGSSFWMFGGSEANKSG